MDHGTGDDLTALLDAVRAGGEDTNDRLVRAVYGELRRMAAGFMRRERTDHTLQPSALVNEAVIRLLVDGGLVKTQDRRYLFAAAAQAMRQVLVDHARTRDAAKRAGGRGRVPLDDVLAYFEAQHLDVIARQASGRVDLGGCPPRSPTDPGLHITRTRFLTYDFAALRNRLWTTRGLGKP